MFVASRSMPTSGIRFFSVAQHPLDIIGTNASLTRDEQLAKVVSVTISNPALDEISSATLYWQLYDDRDLSAPIASGVMKPSVFKRALRIHEQGSIDVGLDLAVPDESKAYRVRVGFDTVVYDNGRVWQRP